MIAATARSWRERYRLRLLAPLGELLCGGVNPGRLVWALAVGILLGCMPLVWGTSLLCLGAALVPRLNPLAVQVGNFAAWPLQLLLAYPYLWLGSVWFGESRLPVGAAKATWSETLLAADGAALGAWLLTSPALLLICYPAGRWLVALTGRATENMARGHREVPSEGP
jgi:hypothetical protein